MEQEIAGEPSKPGDLPRKEQGDTNPRSRTITMSSLSILVKSNTSEPPPGRRNTVAAMRLITSPDYSCTFTISVVTAPFSTRTNTIW